MFRRNQIDKLIDLAKGYPVVCVIGPRQSGKTTLVKYAFPDYKFISLENLDNRIYAERDPRQFLSQYSHRVIIDEAQLVPSLFSYIQTKVDESDIPGSYIFTGSAQLSLHAKVSQSLAGRIALLRLLPLSISEIIDNGLLKQTIYEQLLHGFYPRVYKHNLRPSDWYSDYIDTYIERDVRQMMNIKNLTDFQRFLYLCAGRHGQLLNITSLSNDCGISCETVKNWINILITSFVIYLLPSYHNNYNKRVIRAPKLYFYDSGLVCALLNITAENQLRKYYLRGSLFEGYVITECLKKYYHKKLRPKVYYWKETNGKEIDCILEIADEIKAVEVKSAETISQDFFKNLQYWQKHTANNAENCFLVHGGNSKEKRKYGTVLGWNMIDDIFANQI